MYITLGKKLRNMSSMRLFAGAHITGWQAIFILSAIGIVYFLWYMLLAVLWIYYGIGWLFYMACKGIKKLFVKAYKVICEKINDIKAKD